ncbi:hypothetical protein YZ12_03790, partial [Campylobacter lari]|nr:hypothetical protein [Campylobacter lari]
MKRIAIQFYGHVRTFDKCFQKFIDNILIPNTKDGYNIDVFIHTWDEFSTKTEGVWHNNKNYYPTLDNKKLKECDIERIIALYKPKEIVVDNVVDKCRKMIFDGNHKNGSDISFEKVVKIRKEYESKNNIKYDYILTTRMDIFFMKEFKINTFINIYNSNSCMRQVPLPEKYILTHIDTTFKVLDIAYPTDIPLFFISNFDVMTIKELFYNFYRMIIFCDYKKNVDFKILR